MRADVTETGAATVEHSVGVVALDGLDTDRAAEAVLRAGRRLARLLTR